MPLPEHAALRAANRATDEKWKKKKDDKKAKWRVKERAKLDRGKRWQGSEEKEEEEEEGDGSRSPIQWNELGSVDEEPSLPQVGPFPWHAPGQEGENAPPELVESSCPAPSGPSAAP